MFLLFSLCRWRLAPGRRADPSRGRAVRLVLASPGRELSVAV